MDSKAVASNKKALRDFVILESQEAGIELVGSEVKSLRQSNASLNDSFARIEGGQIFLNNLHIAPYTEASYLNVEPTRTRRLLLHRAQIRKLQEKTSQRGLTLIPLKLYFNKRGIVKVELALAKGKKAYDHRQDIRKRETDMTIRRAMRRRR